LLIADASLINREPEREDIDILMIPANEIAETLGNRRMTNMVMLGALLTKSGVLPVETVKQALIDHLPERHKHLLELNFKALQKGADCVTEYSIDGYKV